MSAGAPAGAGEAAGRGVEVRLEDVAVAYPGRPGLVLDGVDATFAAGETSVLLGPSGCGKSSLLRTLNRLVAPARGRVTLDGVDVATREPTELRRGVGYVIQSGGLLPHYTVAGNVGLVPALLGWDAAAIAARVDELLRVVRLDPARYADRRPRRLSGGEAQRVGVARALAARPGLILMDEPFGALDPVVRRELRRDVFAGVRRSGATVVMVTHDVGEALRVADRVFMLREGRVVQAATPLELLRRPVDAATADFVGAGDRLRALSLLRVASLFDAAPSGGAPPGADAAPAEGAAEARVDAEATLYEALNRLLAEGLTSLAAYAGERRLGAVDLPRLLAALAAP